MADAIQKIFSNEPIHNGYAVYGDMVGNTYNHAPRNDISITVSGINNVLKDRLHDDGLFA